MIPATMHERTRNAPSVARLDTCEEKLLAEEVQEYQKSPVRPVREDYVSEFPVPWVGALSTKVPLSETEDQESVTTPELRS